ncbi:hypothetical protein VTK56DRAFT_9842 [Thermocarpiscus australiensis]
MRARAQWQVVIVSSPEMLAKLEIAVSHFAIESVATIAQATYLRIGGASWPVHPQLPEESCREADVKLTFVLQLPVSYTIINAHTLFAIHQLECEQTSHAAAYLGFQFLAITTTIVDQYQRP